MGMAASRINMLASRDEPFASCDNQGCLASNGLDAVELTGCLARQDFRLFHQPRLSGATDCLIREGTRRAMRRNDHVPATNLGYHARQRSCLGNQPWLLREASGLIHASNPLPRESDSLTRETGILPCELQLVRGF